MKTKVKWNLVTGDPNLVTANEIYVDYDADGSIKSLSKRTDSGELSPFLIGSAMMQAILEEAVEDAIDDYISENIEDVVNYSVDLNTAQMGTYNIGPSEGKTAMASVHLQITDSSIPQ